MSAQADIIRIQASALGGPGKPDPGRCSQAAIDALLQVVGPGMRLTSLSLDLAGQPLGLVEISIRTKIDKRTRAIVFASVEARAGDLLAFSAQGLFGPAGEKA
jgi:hypothetical protein